MSKDTSTLLPLNPMHLPTDWFPLLGVMDFNRQCYRRISHRLASALSKKRH